MFGGTGLYVNSLIHNYNFEEDLKYIENEEILQKLKNTDDALEKERLYNEMIVEFRKNIITSIETGKTTLDDLYKKALEIDEESAKKIVSTDKKRIIKILEIYYTTKKTKTFMDKVRKENQENKKEYILVDGKKEYLEFIIFELQMDREKLYSRIDERVDVMLKEGLLEEVKTVIEYIENAEKKDVLELMNTTLITSLQAIRI